MRAVLSLTLSLSCLWASGASGASAYDYNLALGYGSDDTGVAGDLAETGAAGRKATFHHGTDPHEGKADLPAFGGTAFTPHFRPEKPHSVFWIPFVSFLLPGFDQWWEGQTPYAMAYTGIGFGSYLYSEQVYTDNDIKGAQKRRQDQEKKNGNNNPDDSLDVKDNATRKFTLGQLLYNGAGGFSAYHSFRTAVRTHRQNGEYAFLAHEEEPLDILTAPFHFEFLARKTTWIPLLVGGSIAYLTLQGDAPKGMVKDSFRSDDAFFTTAYSFNAGMWEEATFRGWLMPTMKQKWLIGMDDYWGDWTADLIQATLFALAHLSTNSLPVPQFALGLYLGRLDQHSGWSISEGVFIHAWWDVMAFATVFSYKLKDPNDPTARALRPVLWLPPLQLEF